MSIPRLLKIGTMTHVMTPEGGRPLSCGEKLVLYALSDQHGRYGAYARCTQSDLANWCRLSVDGVRRITRELEKDKVLVIDRPKVSCHGSPFHYVVNEAKLYWQSPALEGRLTLPLRVDSVEAKGSSESTPSPKATKSTQKHGKAGDLDCSSNLVEADNCERADKARAHASKTNGKTELDLVAIEGLLMQGLKRIDPRLAVGLVSDCLAANPDVTTAQVLAVLGMIFAEGIPAHIKRKAGFVRTEAAARVRQSYLDALDEAARQRMRAAGREPGPRSPDPGSRKVN